MNTYDKHLKHLAEAYVAGGKSLTESEFAALKNSKYKNLLKEDTYKSKFTNLFENALGGKSIEKGSRIKPYALGHSRHLNINTARHLVTDLIDDLEEKFGIGIENESLSKHDKISLTDVKDFVKYYCVKKHQDHENTFKRIAEAIQRARSVKSFLLELRSMTI